MEIFKENDEFFKVLADAVSEAILVVNRNQIIVAANASAHEMFGYDLPELVGAELATLIPNKYHQKHEGHFNGFIAHQEKRRMGSGLDLFGKRKDGSTFPVEAGLNPMKIEDHQYVMAIISDITIRKKQEQEILNLNESLEEKVALRTEELNTSIEDLKNAIKKRRIAEGKLKESLAKEKVLNELKTKFLSLVSHEFKTPLTGILTSATLAKKYPKETQQDKREKHLNTIQNKVKYLNNILNDFLSIERLESGKVTYKTSKFPLSKVINEVVYDANMLLKDGQQIIYPLEVNEIFLEFDEKILELSLTNLINNAIKYSPENTTIKLETKVHKDKLELHIVDQGIGIPKEEIPFIFNRYYRAQNAVLTQGTGIGLNIVQSHLKNLDGSISFVSKEGEGTTFTITIPFKS